MWIDRSKVQWYIKEEEEEGNFLLEERERSGEGNVEANKTILNMMD